MADNITDIPEVDATRQQLILEMVQRELAASAKLRPLVTDVSEFALPGHKNIEFPKYGSFSVQKLQQGQKADAQALTASNDVLNLDQLADIQFVLKKQAELQSRLRLEQAYMQRAASAHGRQVDIDILEEMIPNAAAGNAVTYNAGDIRDNVEEVVQKLDEAFAPEENRFLVFRPAQKKLLLAVENFVSAEKYGDRTPILTGEIGMAFGLRFVMSNISSDNFVDGVMVGFQSEAMAVGFQMDPMIDEMKAIEYGAGSRRIAIDQLYGVKTLQDGNLISVVS
jgi:hypothetical protein